MTNKHRIGKLSNAELEELVLSKFHPKRPEVVLPPGVGLDCGLVDMQGDLCALSSDPITGATEKMGALAVHVCCNDAAASGAEPVGILTTLLLPPDTDNATVASIAADVSRAADLAHVDVLGGHTEFTDAVTRPVISATVLARAPRDRMVNSAQMKSGDTILLSKWAALEGSFIIAADHPAKLDGALAPEEWRELSSWAEQLSVVEDAMIAVNCGARALHDATEGGVLGAVWEMAMASHTGVEIDSAKIPVREETKKICAALGLDPLRMMTSGALLIAVADPAPMEKAFAESGIPLAVIGKATAMEKGLRCDGQALEAPGEDELYRIWQ